jgi:hypothetical protein
MGKMKRLLIILFILHTIFVNGQSSVYKPFPTSYGNWVYRYYDDFHNPTPYQTQYTLTGDTIISTITYKKIFIGSAYQGALRENAKKIYFIPDTSSTEYLLYNFNLVVGDTIIHPFGGAVCTNDTLTIAYVDSVLLSDGYHKQFSFNPIAPNWIEGVGSIEYLLAPLQTLCVSGNDLIECMVSDTAFSYLSSSCFLPVNELQNSSTSISIFPNPFSYHATVLFDTYVKNALIKITDIFGREIKTINFSGKDLILEKGEMKDGIYFTQIILENKKYITKKIIIQ